MAGLTSMSTCFLASGCIVDCWERCVFVEREVRGWVCVWMESMVIRDLFALF